ncbi:hydroxyisourate hydrolase [Bacillus marasmi]|uniref:hydroxyisourate hydrolase n=1 Tax=Bacillus marasmi TaxID=1926279 RepID=UPI0011C9AE29|nr:hydroxyisourate hydrolase [Bacillus marasmi]
MKIGLTTHVLDLTNGIPAKNIKVELAEIHVSPDERVIVSTAFTNEEGRIESGLLSEIKSGEYELVFHVGTYFLMMGTPVSEPIFFNKIPVRFSINSEVKHYHIPLLISPWGYQTYRGS